MSNLTNLLTTLLQSFARTPQTTTNIQHSFGVIASYNRNIEDYNRNIEDYNRNIRHILPVLQEVVALDTRPAGTTGSANALGYTGPQGSAQDAAQGSAQGAEGTTGAQGSANNTQGSANNTQGSANNTQGLTWDQHPITLPVNTSINNNEHAYYYLAALLNFDLSGANVFDDPVNRAFGETDFSLHTTQYNYVEPIPAPEEPELCSITMEPLTNGTPVIQITRCGHVFKAEALTTWFQTSNTCPLCRQNLRSR
jgi:hypothetical protein